MSHFLLSTTQNIITCFIHFDMSEEQQQSLKDSPYEVVTHPNAVPPMHHNQPTIPRDCAVTVSSTADVLGWSTYSQWVSQIHPAPETSQADIFVPPLAAQRGYYDPLNIDYPRSYGS